MQIFYNQIQLFDQDTENKAISGSFLNFLGPQIIVS